MTISGIHNEIVECINPSVSQSGDVYQNVLGTLRVDSGKQHWRFIIISELIVAAHIFEIVVAIGISTSL